jgi:putative tricarboxylic transport membrane protein
MRRDSVAAIFLFIVFAAYGQQALQIQMFPGQELEPFKPRTMPVALAVAGMLLCIIHLLQTLRIQSADAFTWSAYDWRRAATLCIVMLGYGYAFTPLGFIVATTLFLLAGFLTLGERRIPVLILLPVVFTLSFWGVMTQLLGLYLAPGDWWPGGSN